MVGWILVFSHQGCATKPRSLKLISCDFLVHAKEPESKTGEGDPDSQVPDYDIEESIDLGSLKSLHTPSHNEVGNEKDIVDPISVTDSHNLTYVTANKDDDEKQPEIVAPKWHRSKITVATGRSSSRMKDPVGCSTPNSRSPECEKELKRRSFPLPHPTTTTSAPVVQSGKGTYFVKGSSHHHHHRPASELFLESNSKENAFEQVHVEPDRPLSQLFSGPFDKQLSNRTTFGTIPNRHKSNTSRRESANEDESAKIENQESAPESLKSLRAEMEMKRREIQKQRAHEDREKRKHRQKVSEAAFFKAIQPRSQSAINIESYQNMDDASNAVMDRYNTFSNNTRNPSVSDMSIQTSIEVSQLGGGPGSGGQHGLNPTSPDDGREPVFPSGLMGEHHALYYGDNVAERDLLRTASLDWLVEKSKHGTVVAIDLFGISLPVAINSSSIGSVCLRIRYSSLQTKATRCNYVEIIHYCTTLFKLTSTQFDLVALLSKLKR